MKTFLKRSALVGLLVVASARCLGSMSIAPVSKQRAKELGIEFRAKANGPKEVWVELEFKAEGELKDFDHVSLEIREGEKLLLGYAPLKATRSRSGAIAVGFLANRAYLDRVTLSIVVGYPMNYAGYELRVKDFVEPDKKPARG